MIRFWVILIVLGTGWGLTQPFTKITVSGDYRDFGIIFWQNVIVALILGLVCLMQGKRLRLGRPQLKVYVIIALVGTVLPNVFSYTAYKHLDAGIMAILISMVPIFALPIALALGVERLKALRVVGLVLGLIGVLLLILPGQTVIGAASLWFIPIGLMPSLLYAFEGNYIARWGTEGLDAIQALFGASLVGIVVTGPMALINGSWITPLPPYGMPDLALVISASIHAMVYTGYVWLVAAAGSVFAVQVSYIVTISGITWSQIILGESYSSWVWLALVFVLAGVFLVQPKPGLRVAPASGGGQD